MSNLDRDTVESFGDEWTRHDQGRMDSAEARRVFEEYFAIFPWDALPPGAEGFDMGCGSGRWARWVAPRVGHLHCVDPSVAIDLAKANLAGFDNLSFHRASVDDQALPAGSQDFGYSLGVLHHVPDTAAALASCVAMLKPGAPMLLYLYYAFDTRPAWFRSLWRLTDLVRRVICRLRPGPKSVASNLIAVLVYWPLAMLSRALEGLGRDVSAIPLSYYRNHSFLTMRTDARDRFGTPLEQRFSREQIGRMMAAAGLVDITFSESAPFWCTVGYKA